MKTKYERMSNVEKRNTYKQFKLEKVSLAKKMRNMFILIYLGIGYSIFAFLYDFIFAKSKFGYMLDVIVFIFCLLALLRVN